MPELKHNFTKGRMNKDLDERMVPKGEYRDALNVEVSTSEGSNVGTVQTLKGNTLITGDAFGADGNATCVGVVSNESENKLYWLVSDPDINPAASATQTFTSQTEGDISITHNIHSDYIMEYDEIKNERNYVVVEHYEVTTTISNASHTSGDHLHISNLDGDDIRTVGIQVGMDVEINGMVTTITKIEAEDPSTTWNGWRVYTEHTASDTSHSQLSSVVAGDTVNFKLPYNKRALGFSYFASQKRKKAITGINIIDGLLFWTDGLTEPKNINIKRCIYGSQQLLPSTYLNGTRALPTLLVVNGDLPSSDNGRLGDVSLYPSAITHPFLSYKQTTVIKKSPTDPLILTMSNTTKGDQQPKDGLVIVNTEVTVGGDFFFNFSGDRLGNGDPAGTSLTFSPAMDWEEDDILEFFAEDDDAGFQNEPIAVLIVTSVLNGDTFTFEIQSISNLLIKPYRDFRVRLRQDDPLFEFKFPRFAYRWKYEDGEYSCYSPFSEVAFLPEEFDYLPKKGYNLGMTNNLRYLVLSGFKPKTMPLDVVEIDILYKESNSPNVYTIDTIKSPSIAVGYLGTDNFDAADANAWFGKIKHQGFFREIPTTLSTSLQLVGVSALTGSYTGDFYTLEDRFDSINLKVGDVITLGTIGNIGTGTLKVSGMQDTVVTTTIGGGTNSLGTYPSYQVDQIFSQISISSTDASGVVTAITGSAGTWLTAGNDTTFQRNIADKPAVYINDPIGSFRVKTDMIHATVPSNQLLRPYDNVPRSALSQEITGNRIVYGNYVQNYNLVDSNNKLTKVSFKTSLHNRSNVRQNVRYDDRTALVNQNNGSTLDWWDAGNQITPTASKPERSLKSLRDYQLGVAYMDEFGRQSPIQTHSDAVQRISKDYANKYNSLRVKLDPEHSSFPDWATHFKFYIKENANEYYNLAMDRFYSAEDGNIWLSFPSSERNKVDEETFLILKKQHDNDVFVSEAARYKILAIENEAPLFVKTKYNAYGIITPAFSPNGHPRIESSFIDIVGSAFGANTNLAAAIDATAAGKERVLRVSSGSNKSRWYDISSIITSGSYKRVVVSKPFGIDMAFTTEDNTSSGVYIGGVTVEIAYKEVKNLPEFSGRFFVKIHKDGTFIKNITALAPDRNFIAVNSFRCANLTNHAPGGNINNGDGQAFWAGHRNSYAGGGTSWSGIPGGHFFVDKVPGVGVHIDDNGPGGGSWQDGDGIGYQHGVNSSYKQWLSPETQASLDISYHDFHEPGGRARDLGPWHINWSNTSPSISTAKKAIGVLLRAAGTLFRFKGDSTVYKITACRNHAVENYDDDPGGVGGYKLSTNHREKFRVEFTPKIGAAVDAVGQVGSGYNPFDDGIPGDTNVTNNWLSNWESNNNTNNHKRTIEFLEEFVADNSYTSDNPAIWETEPKENVDIDLYNEASAALPIEKEFDTYKNEFYNTGRHTSYNALDYYNCFSFNNGVESNRIRDDYNTVTIDKGPKVSTVLAEQYKEEHRKSGLIYSGIYNSISGINNLNQFVQAEKITKDINPTYGSIQKLYSRDTNLITLCEDRVIKVLANKDALYNADGNSNITSTNNVLGDATPYVGDFGISTDPESFAVDQYRAYFTDKSRGAVMRLSRDGLTAISNHGMRDYFKDVLKVDNLSLVGSYDENKKLYNLTMREGPNNLTRLPAIEVVDGDGLDFIDHADANIIGHIPFDLGGQPGADGDGTGPFQAGSTSTPYLHGTIGSASTNFQGPNGTIQAFGQYNISNVATAGGFIGNILNVTQFHLPKMDYYSSSIDTRLTALTSALDSCPNGNVYLHAQIQAGTPSGEQSGTYYNTGYPIATFKVNSIVTSSNRYELNVEYYSGVMGGNIDTYYFWYSTEGCEVEFGGDSSTQINLRTDGLGFSEITASFSEDSKGWSSFKSWLQESGTSLNDSFFTFNSGELYHHHSNETRNSFYGTEYDSTVCAIFNDEPSSIKSFGSLSYEGSQSRVVANLNDGEYYNQANVNGWYAEYVSTGLETGFIPEFKNKEGKWFNYIRGNQANTLLNLDVNQFSTQGIGTPSVVSTDEQKTREPFTLTIKNK